MYVYTAMAILYSCQYRHECPKAANLNTPFFAELPGAKLEISCPTNCDSSWSRSNTMAGHPWHPRTPGHQGRHPTMAALGSLTNPPVPLALLAEGKEKQDWGTKINNLCYETVKSCEGVEHCGTLLWCVYWHPWSLLIPPIAHPLFLSPLVHLAWVVSLIFLQCSIFKVEGAVDFVVQTFLASVVGPNSKGALHCTLDSCWVGWWACRWLAQQIHTNGNRVHLCYRVGCCGASADGTCRSANQSCGYFSLLTEFCLQMRPREDRANDLT